MTARPLRVLFAVDSDFPSLGGAQGQALKIAQALRRRGVHVQFLAPAVVPGRALADSVDGFLLHRLRYPRVRWLGSLALMVSLARYLHRHASQHDVMHVHITHLMAATAGYTRRSTDLPVIAKISGYYEFAGGVLDHERRWRPMNVLLRLGLRSVDKVQTISRETEDKLLQAGFDATRIACIPNGIEIGSECPAAPGTDGLRIGYLGRLRAVKGVDLLLRAMAALTEAHPGLDVRLSIAGEGSAEADLRQLADVLGLAERIDWLGVIDDTRTFFEHIDIYAQPSWAEGLPNSVMEAMAGGRPVVASEIGGNVDLVTAGQTGLIFPPGDVPALTACLSELITDAPLRRQLAENAWLSIHERYAMEVVIDRLLELYVSTVGVDGGR